jgi:hydrogenase-4 component F
MQTADLILVLALLLPPLVAAAVSFVLRGSPRAASWFNATTMPITLIAALVVGFTVVDGARPVAVGAWWRIDALSALLVGLIAVVATLSSWLGPGFERDGGVSDSAIRSYRIYANLFTCTMLAAVSTSNLGVMWVALEASTVTSALLISVRHTKAAADASWKYLIIGSVGIALAFAGTVLAFVDYAAMGFNVDLALHWTTLRERAPSLHPEVVQLAFVFALVGFGTKAGLAPTHTWLPEAHAEAPAALSAMMSGVLLAVALYAVARWKAIVDMAVGPAFSDTLLLVVGVATILVGTLCLLPQTEFKRLLAYSSIEHTGLACIGLALGPLGVFAALLHLVGHALAKSTAFLLAGRVYERYRSGEIARTSGLLAVAPRTGILFGAGVFALAGVPPFGLFLSEVLIVRAAWTTGHVALATLMLALLLLAFGSLMIHLEGMLCGEADDAVPRGEHARLPAALLAIPVVLLVWIGVALPVPLQTLLTRAVEVLHP